MRQTVLTKYKHNIVHSPSLQSNSPMRKPSGGESPPPSSTRSIQDLGDVQSCESSSWPVCSPSNQQGLDHYDEVLIFYTINPTVSPLSLIKLEQACQYRLLFKKGRYSTRPDWLYLATVARANSGAFQFFPPVTIKWSPTSIPHAALQCNGSDEHY